jgi:hypothetical protein
MYCAKPQLDAAMGIASARDLGETPVVGRDDGDGARSTKSRMARRVVVTGRTVIDA